MFLAIRVLTVFLVAVTMALALAHALELPGKLRLDERTYLSVQAIYYPGFTIGGAAEPLAVIATLSLLVRTPRGNAQFWFILTAFCGVAGAQLVFWLVTQPTNRFWLRNVQLGAAGARFFSVGREMQLPERSEPNHEWRRLRTRWEYSHLVRSVLSGIALIAIVIAVAM